MVTAEKLEWFTGARYGMFVHFGLYSQLGRGEWIMNRERLDRSEVEALAKTFDPKAFSAEAICDLAVESGMKYITLTTMHHDGFRLYDTELSAFNSKKYCGRDLVEEIATAARKYGLKLSLYHSLNNWYDQPDAVDALESRNAYEEFIAKTFTRIQELVTRFNPIDILWYDGWWPFHAGGWRAEKMNEMVRSIQPEIMFNGRNGLAGDFGTPEGHMSVPSPWRPWEACMTLNNHWGYHQGDNEWKNPLEVIGMLARAAMGRGNLLLNIGPRGDGSIPEQSVKIIRSVGDWLRYYGECIYGHTNLFTYAFNERADHTGDWAHNGPFTLKAKTLYQILRYYPGSSFAVAGLDTKVESGQLLTRDGAKKLNFTQKDGRVMIKGLPEKSPDPLCPVLRLDCEKVPTMYLTGGMRVPKVKHAPYDPCPSDIGWNF